jgi:integrase/recombinase XerC
MEDSTIIQDFLNYLQFEKRFSPHTAKCYGVDLLQFGEFITARADGSSGSDGHSEGDVLGSGDSGTATAVATHPKVDVDQVLTSTDVNGIRNYMAGLNDKQYSKATIARKLATLRSFYKFLVKRNRITSNPVVGIRNRKNGCRSSSNTKRSNGC